jgi:hypothetical protein
LDIEVMQRPYLILGGVAVGDDTREADEGRYGAGQWSFLVIDEQFATRLWEETGLRGLVLGDKEQEQEEEEGMTEEERKEL